jgi:HEAT repeat protein
LNSLLLAAAGASLCLAILTWIALVAARGIRHRVSVRRRQRRPRAGLALAEYCADGDAVALAAKLEGLPLDDVIAVAGRALPMLAEVNRKAVGDALARCGLARQVRARFGRASENTRILYCEVLGAVGDDAAVAGLESAVRRGSAAVRIAAAIALVELGKAPPLAPLLKTIGRGARRSSRLVYLLEKIAVDREAEVAALVLDDRAEPRLRVSALQALAIARPPAHRSLLLRLGQEPCALLAVAVARALARGETREGGAVLVSLLSHPAPQVRREAAAAAGSASVVRALPALERLTGDRDPPVAAAAARSMWLLHREQVRLRSAPAHLKGVAA